MYSQVHLTLLLLLLCLETFIAEAAIAEALPFNTDDGDNILDLKTVLDGPDCG